MPFAPLRERFARDTGSSFLRGRFNGFSVERMMLMLTKLGRDVEVVMRPAARRKAVGGITLRREVA